VIHLDLLVDGQRRRHSARWRWVPPGSPTAATWITLADPAGHPFDLCQRDGVGPQMQLFAGDH